MNRRWYGALVASGALTAALGAFTAAPREAGAQVWLEDRARAEGRGIRTGNFELHPGVGAEFGYDSNVFYSSANPISALRLRVTPSFFVSTLGARRTANSDSPTTALPTVNFRGGAALTYHEWIATGDGDRVSGLRNLGAQASLRFDFFPQRTWQFSLGNEFTRTIQPGPEASPVVPSGTAPNTFNRNFNRAFAEMAYAPGRGTFEFRLNYGFVANLFDSDDFSQFSYLSHDILARVRWRFLPKTALVWEGGATPMSYNEPSRGTTGLFSSTPLRTRVGLNGLISERIQLLLLAGYQATFFEGGDNADTVIGQAELRWIINPTSHLRGGFQRDIQNSFFGNFAVRNRGYLAYQQSFGGRFVLSLDGGVGLYEYGYLADRNGARATTGSGFDPTDGRFSAVRIEGTAFAEYRPSEVVGLNLTFRGASNISDARFGTTTGLDGQPGQSIAWNRFEAFLGARVNW